MKWFKHDSDANLDAKLQNVMLDYGLEGYGLYWYCIEMIVGKIDQDNLTFQLEHDARIIARNTGSTAQKVEEMMRYFVKLGLFDDRNGDIVCLKLLNRIDKSMTSNNGLRRAIDQLKSGESHDPVMTESCKNRIEKNRTEENRTEEKSKGKSSRFVPPTHAEVFVYCDERQNNVDPERFINFYESKGWMVGKNKMKDWKAAVRNWERNNKPSKSGFSKAGEQTQQAAQEWLKG